MAVVPFLGRLNVDQQEAGGSLELELGMRGMQNSAFCHGPGWTIILGWHISMGTKAPLRHPQEGAASSNSTSALDATTAPGALADLSRCLFEVG